MQLREAADTLQYSDIKLENHVCYAIQFSVMVSSSFTPQRGLKIESIVS